MNNPKGSYIVSVFNMIWIVIHQPLHHLFLISHDTFVEGGVTIVVSSIGPSFLVKLEPIEQNNFTIVTSYKFLH